LTVDGEKVMEEPLIVADDGWFEGARRSSDDEGKGKDGFGRWLGLFKVRPLTLSRERERERERGEGTREEVGLDEQNVQAFQA
jgi:hypothetical protein